MRQYSRNVRQIGKKMETQETGVREVSREVGRYACQLCQGGAKNVKNVKCGALFCPVQAALTPPTLEKRPRWFTRRAWSDLGPVSFISCLILSLSVKKKAVGSSVWRYVKYSTALVALTGVCVRAGQNAYFYKAPSALSVTTYFSNKFF